MTTMFHGIKRRMAGDLIPHRIEGVIFDEVAYADDTICMCTHEKTMTRFIQAIEKEGKTIKL